LRFSPSTAIRSEADYNKNEEDIIEIITKITSKDYFRGKIYRETANITLMDNYQIEKKNYFLVRLSDPERHDISEHPFTISYNIGEDINHIKICRDSLISYKCEIEDQKQNNIKEFRGLTIENIVIDFRKIFNVIPLTDCPNMFDSQYSPRTLYDNQTRIKKSKKIKKDKKK